MRMGETLRSLGLIAIGMCVAHVYNWIAWRKYYEGRDEYRGRRRDA